jgi:hypothetical protein
MRDGGLRFCSGLTPPEACVRKMPGFPGNKALPAEVMELKRRVAG